MPEQRPGDLAGSEAVARGDARGVDRAGDSIGRGREVREGASAAKGRVVRLLGRRPGQVFEHLLSEDDAPGGRDDDPRSPETKAAFARVLNRPHFPCMAALISCGRCTERVTPCLLSPEAALRGIARHGPAEEPWLLRVEEASRLLGLGRTRTWELIWNGDLPAVRMGRAVRVDREDLKNWVQARKGARS